MDRELLETFVVLCETGNITRTAELLHRTQPAVSGRIRQLEEHLGYTLVYREKGRKKVSITPKGQAFLEVSRKLIALYGEIEATEAQISNTLRISSIYSLSSPIAVPVCRRLSMDYQIKTTLETYQTDDAYRMVADKTLDAAFVSDAKITNGVKTEALASLEYSVVRYCQNPTPPKTISVSDLDPALEIYQRWNEPFEIWHDSAFPQRAYPLQIDSVGLLPDFMAGNHYWSIVQNVNLSSLQAAMSLQIYHLREAPPPRICYVITSQFPDRGSIQVLRRFREALSECLRTMML